MLVYIEQGCEYTLEFGDMWEQFYTTLEGNFDKAMRFIFLNGLLACHYERIEKLIDSVSNCGWGFYDTLQDIYSEYREWFLIFDKVLPYTNSKEQNLCA